MINSGYRAGPEMIRQGSPATPFRSTGRHDGGHAPNVPRGIAQRRRRGIYRRTRKGESDQLLVLSCLWLISLCFLSGGLFSGIVHGFATQMSGKSFLLTGTQATITGSIMMIITAIVTVLSLKRGKRS